MRVLPLALARGSWLPTIRGTLFTINFIDSLLYFRSERLFPSAGAHRRLAGVRAGDRTRLDTSNLCFNCHDLLSVQRHSPGAASDPALNSNAALGGFTPDTRSLLGTGVPGKLLALSGDL